MGDSPKFLYRVSEWGDWFASLGRRRKADKRNGIDDPALLERYQVLKNLLRWRKAKMRHYRWWKTYEIAYEAALDDAFKDGMTEKQADKYAKQKAEQTVLDAFPDEVTHWRTVRNAFDDNQA